MECTDTRIGNTESDTVSLGITRGLRVRVCAGELEGLEGTVVERRPGGKILIRVQHAIYIEIARFYLKAV